MSNYNRATKHFTKKSLTKMFPQTFNELTIFKINLFLLGDLAGKLAKMLRHGHETCSGERSC